MIATRDLKTILKAVKLNATKSDMEEVLEELEDDKGKISVDDFYKLTMTESSSKSNKGGNVGNPLPIPTSCHCPSMMTHGRPSTPALTDYFATVSA